MKRFKFDIIAILVLLIMGGCKGKVGTTYKLYYLGGQSNMDGYGYVEELPPGLAELSDYALIFHGNTSPDSTLPDGKGLWSVLRPGHGVGFSSDGTTNNYSERFGVELSFASKLHEIDPEAHLAILKYSRGGTSIDEEAAGYSGSWDPDYMEGEGINQYDHFLAAVELALGVEDIDGDGLKDRFVPSGIIWMQGESDALYTEEIAKRYYNNLSRLMTLIRQALGSDEIPVVIGRISDSGNHPSGSVWRWGDIVRDAEKEYTIDDPNAGLVTSTGNYGYSDPWHYDSMGYIDLGKQFAIVLDSLNRR